ncbi:hypothetical protein RN001_013608 [Aquatica leii]|uniref:SWI/SNF-related matrix-associated actin-dependent regulator of chromatin subfamily A-like protein 1 n=1 Tax=Aquatica leii TaxID=1421715 RepID=A0AAN7QDC1_9COLE|nr:hypothetical protein RN001_013608 [Aquatica leii]
MQCTAEEIERKRKLAQEKLLNNKIKNTTNNFNHEKPGSVSPFKFKRLNAFTHNKDNLKSPVTKSVNSFSPYNKPKQVLQFYGKNAVVTGTCMLTSENRFVVDLSGYSHLAVEIFKTLKSRSYDAKTRQWEFDLADYDVLFCKLAALQPDVIITKLPVFVVNCCKTSKLDYSNIDLSCIDKELLNVLMPFQVHGVCFGIDKNGRCLIADEMGLGKTFQALAIADYYKEDWPLLIVTTSSMKNEWESTIHKYLPSVSVMHTQYMTSAKDYIGDCKVLIVSYDMMTRCLEKLLERNFKVLIMDESHTIKNFKSKCTKAATELSKKAKRIILLSGTPALSRPSELYQQLALLDDKFFGNFFEFSKRYCDGKTTNFGWDASGKSNLQELEIILAKKFMIRRTKEDVLKALPNKEQQIVELDVNLNQFSEDDRKFLNSLAHKYNRQKKASDKQAALLTFFSETSRIKIPPVCSFVLQTLELRQKFIVFAHHQKMLDAIEKVISKKKLKFIRIDGNTSSTQRKYLIDKFQVNDDYLCALLSITAANAGITLTAAKLVVFAELHWNPSILSQAESRAHRIGQDEKVIVKYLLARGTADDSIWTILQKKQNILKEAGLFKDSFDNLDVTKQDLKTSRNLTISELFNKANGSFNKERTSNSENSVESEFFNDDFDDKFSNVLTPKSNSENIGDSGSVTKSELFNDDFDELLLHHDLENKPSNAGDSMEINFLDDGFDEMLSNVQLNI